MADLAYALGTFLAAGIPAPSAWRLSAKLVNDPRYNQAIAQLEPCFTAGQDPSIELPRFKCFPADFKAFYSTGAQSGQLENNLLKAGRQYQERANRTMTLASILYPTLMLAIIAMLVIYIIFNVFSGYLNALDGITG